VYYRGNWYLDAWCHLRRGLRSFSLDAIKKATILPSRAREVPHATLDKHLGAGYGIYAGAARYKAVLRFAPTAARWVAREQWHTNQQQRPEANGFLVLTIPYSRDEELVMDILRYGGDVEVLKPASLRVKVEAALKSGLQIYRQNEDSRQNRAAPLSTLKD
jgi:predicted DNA-binding transcriptional regulator YafY